MTSPFTHFGIIGAGAWGTALAQNLCRNHTRVTLWTRQPDHAASLNGDHINHRYLPHIPLDTALNATSKIDDLAPCDALIVAVPAQHLRATCTALQSGLVSPKPLILACKGIELGTYRLMSEIAATCLPQHPLFILSGPSFADEVARGLPAALTLASEHSPDGLATALSTPTFRIYTTDDMIGTQIGGAVKNVLAIACGIVTGRALGENARAALVTRGLAEIMRLGLALGARAETLMGLSGMGDIVLTCSSPHSRNMSLGIALGQGQALSDILAKRSGVTEGIATATATLGLARRHGIDMPVVSAVDLILRGQASIDSVIANLLARPLRHEST